MVMGLPDKPDLEILRAPVKTSPLLNSILSPGFRPENTALTFEIVFQEVDDESPFAESLPDELT